MTELVFHVPQAKTWLMTDLSLECSVKTQVVIESYSFGNVIDKCKAGGDNNYKSITAENQEYMIMVEFTNMRSWEACR